MQGEMVFGRVLWPMHQDLLVLMQLTEDVLNRE